MSLEVLFQSLQHKDSLLMRETLKTIQNNRRTLDLYLRELERADKACDLNRAAKLKYKQIPAVEAAITQAKEVLLKTIAMNAFELIDKL